MKKSLYLAILLCFLPAISLAATHYISPTGTDTWANSTNIATPCSLATANTNADDDDIVYLRAGTYTTMISPANSGSSGHVVTWQNYNGEEVLVAPSTGSAVYLDDSYHKFEGLKFMPSNPAAGNTYIFHIRGNYNEVKSCSITGTDPEGKRDDGIRLSGIVIEGGDYNTVDDCTVQSLSDQGITSGDNGTNVAIGNTIKNSTSYGHFGNGIAVQSGQSTDQVFLAENNLLGGSIASDGFQTNGDYSVGNTTCWGVTIRGNTLYNNAENGIDIKGARYFVIENNIIYGNIGDNDGFTDDANDTVGGYAINRGSNQGAAYVIVRGNVIFDNHGGILMYQNFRTYHNTILNNRRTYTGPNQTDGSYGLFGAYRQSGPTYFINNISAGNQYQAVTNDDFARSDYNLYYDPDQAAEFYDTNDTAVDFTDWKAALVAYGQTNPEANSSVEDPDLTTANGYRPTGAYTQWDFSPVAAGAADGTAGPVVYVNGTTGTVESCVIDASWFFVVGDQIRIGTDDVTLTSVNSTTISWSGAVAITDNDPIYWCPDGVCMEDIGALPVGTTPPSEPALTTNSGRITTGYGRIGAGYGRMQ